MARVKRTYKDSLFCDIFRRKDYLQDVYRGLFGRDVSLQEIQLMTLQGTFFNDEKNDVSFLAGKRQIVLMEHQSTLNENMPLRMFWYMAKLYRKQVPKDAHRIERDVSGCRHHASMYSTMVLIQRRMNGKCVCRKLSRESAPRWNFASRHITLMKCRAADFLKRVVRSRGIAFSWRKSDEKQRREYVWRGLLSRQSAIVSSRIFWRNIFLSVRWRRFLTW